MKKENNVDKIRMVSPAAEAEAEPEVEVLKSAMSKYCFLRDTSFNNLED